MNNSIIRKSHTFLIDRSFTPAELFTLEHCIEATQSIKHKLIKEEELIPSKKALILWGNQLNLLKNKQVINIADLKKTSINLKEESLILYGNSENFEEYKELIENTLKINILEYENNETLLFEKAS